MAYIKGIGTLSDPYVIHDQAALTEFFTTDMLTKCYAVLACDIDMTGIIIPFVTGVAMPGSLDGYGHTINGIRFKHATNQMAYPSWFGKYSRLCFSNITVDGIFPYFNNSTSLNSWTAGSYEDVLIDGITFTSTSTTSCYAYLKNVIIKNASRSVTLLAARINNVLTVDGLFAYVNSTDIRSYPDKYNSSNYASFSDLLWLKDGSSSPRLKPISEPGLTQIYAVKGVTKIGGETRSRRCRAHSSADFKQIATAVSANDGKYLLNCQRYSDHVYVTHADDYGAKIVANRPYALGDVVHPLTPNGYRYICTTAGTTGDSLPAEPWSISSNVIAGTAIFSPTPIYAAETMLVVPVLYDLSTGLPV